MATTAISPGSAPGESPYAGFWRRAGGWILDSIIVYFALFIAGAVLGTIRGHAGAPTATQWLVAIISLVGPWAYFAGMESSSRQATLGKLAAGIKVTDLAGERISLGRATGRYFAQILSALTFCVGYVMMVFTSQRQSLHDMIAGTLIVRSNYSSDYVAAAGPAPRVSPVVATFAVLGCVLFGPFGIGILAAIAIPTYQDYVVRSQVMEGLNAASRYKIAVSEAAAQGVALTSLGTDQLHLPQSGNWKYVESVNVESGVIAITYGQAANPAIAGKSVLIIPGTRADGTIVWTCGHRPLPTGVTPVVAKDLDPYTDIADRHLPLVCKPGR